MAISTGEGSELVNLDGTILSVVAQDELGNTLSVRVKVLKGSVIKKSFLPLELTNYVQKSGCKITLQGELLEEESGIVLWVSNQEMGATYGVGNT